MIRLLFSDHVNIHVPSQHPRTQHALVTVQFHEFADSSRPPPPIHWLIFHLIVFLLFFCL